MPKFAKILVAVMLIGLRLPIRASAETNDSATPQPSDSGPEKPPAKRAAPRERTTNRRSTGNRRSKAKRDQDRAEWLAKLKANGIEAWPDDESEETHAAALAKSREMVSEVTTNFPGTQLYETKHFLFVSNIPAQQVGPYTASIDKMYDWMCQLYNVPREHKVWLGGKTPIFAFLSHEEFTAFEDRLFPETHESFHTLTNIYGLSHLSLTGEVVISCFRGNDPNDFAQMLVHETSHGFIHRYKSKARLPNWVDEGMADLIGAEMVPASTAVKNREYQAVLRLAQQPSLGGLLKAERIEAWQYGVASNLNRFMIQTNRDNYVRFIEDLKAGDKCEAALRDAYESSPEELLAGYARWLHLPTLQP
jgi:hypothetical protein